MKIAISILNYNKTGGIERHIAELVDRWSKNHEIHVFTSNADLNIVPDNVFIHLVPTINFNLLKSPSFAIFSSILLKQQKFDLIYNNGCGYSFVQDIITSASLHIAWAEGTKNERKNKLLLNPLHYWTFFIEWCNYGLRHYKKVIAISKFIKNKLIKYFNINETDIDIIYHGVNLNEFNPQNKLLFRDSVRSELHLSDDDFVVLFVGKEYRRKGLHLIISALNLINNKKIKLVVVGKDNSSEFSNLGNTVNTSQIIIVGHSADVKKYYAAADIFVFPSSFDAFGLVVLEAMASGLPVITTNTTGASELITNEQDGLILNNRLDVVELKQKILKLYTEPAFLNKLKNNAWKTAQTYSWDVVSDQTLKLFENVYREKIFKK